MGRTLVMGASLKPDRYSYLAVHQLRDSDEPVVAFGKKEGMVADVNIVNELRQYDDIDTVTLYLNSNAQKDFYNYIVSLGPRRVIFNPGTENKEFYSILESNGIGWEEACTLVLLSTHQY